MIEKGVEKAVEAGLLKTTATVIAPKLLGTFTNVLTPFTANAPTPNDSKEAMKANQTKQLTKNTVSALLFYFMNNNQINIKKEDTQQPKAVTDHPEDRQLQRRYGNE